MRRVEAIQLVNKLFECCVKGQIQIDFSGDGEQAQVRFTNISTDEFNKLQKLTGDKDKYSFALK
ncbi:hypothetical protein MUP95_09670 [bacterium]|nr:hypothetical protein [bacterium]